MPVIPGSTYAPPILLASGHLQSIFPTLYRKVRGVHYRRERIITPDDDFLDLDWSPVGSRRIAVLSHGLEGNSTRGYMLGMARALNRSGWDALAWNYRGCSGQMNRTPRFYHSGATEDLHTVVMHLLSQGIYSEVALIGFSLGGNLTLKYLGERGGDLDERIVAAATFSVPCDLKSSAGELARPSRAIYMRRFLRSLEEKVRAKIAAMPGRIPDSGFEGIRSFREFDDRYTAPMHGFRDAEEYWRRNSCRQFLGAISIPTLMVNAKNDPFLAPACYPIAEAEANPNFFLEMPESGGHVGFVSFNREGEYWMERRAIAFLEEHSSVAFGPEHPDAVTRLEMRS
jgi:predicted alpha/beta-fold hydrolase